MLWTITTQQQNHKQPNQKTGKRLRLSSKDVQMANKHMKRGSASLVIRKMTSKPNKVTLHTKLG